jgi:hypothetical protein
MRNRLYLVTHPALVTYAVITETEDRAKELTREVITNNPGSHVVHGVENIYVDFVLSDSPTVISKELPEMF